MFVFVVFCLFVLICFSKLSCLGEMGNFLPWLPWSWTTGIPNFVWFNNWTGLNNMCPHKSGVLANNRNIPCEVWLATMCYITKKNNVVTMAMGIIADTALPGPLRCWYRYCATFLNAWLIVFIKNGYLCFMPASVRPSHQCLKITSYECQLLV